MKVYRKALIIFSCIFTLFFLHPLSILALEDIVIPDPIQQMFVSKKHESKETKNIIVKYKESALTVHDEKEKGKEAEKEIKNIIGKSYTVTDATKMIGSTKDKIEDNKKKFPNRAKRIPQNIPEPDLSLMKKVSVPKKQTETVLQNLKKDENIEYAVLEEPGTPLGPNDPYFIATHNILQRTYLNSWNLRQINLGPTGSGTSGWDIETGDQSTVIANYGAGVDFTHPDMENNIWINPGEFPSATFPGLDANSDSIITLTELKAWATHPLDDFNSDGRIDLADLITTHASNYFLNGVDNDSNGYTDDFMGWNFSSNSNNVYASGGDAPHDTLMASIMMAEGNNGIGMAGINWNARLMSIMPGSQQEAIQYAADNGADVINFSYDGRGIGCKEYVDYAYANGMMVVYASGDYQEIMDTYDSTQSDHTWLVSATTQSDGFESRSARGRRLDLSAPGDIDGGYFPQDYAYGMQLRSLLFLAKDNSGNPALVYFDPLLDALRYGLKSGGTWSFEDVDTSGIVNGIYPSLAFDTSNNPHVSYFDWENKKLKYAVKSAGSWSTQTLTDSGDQGYGTSIAVDSSSHPRIAYTDCTNHLIKMKNYNGVSWDDDTVGSSGTGSDCYDSQISLALDSSGDPNLSYYDLGATDLLFAIKKSGVWSIETVDSNGTAGKRQSMVLDASDHPHIVYVGTGSHPKYATKNGTWSTQILTIDHYVMRGINSIALDSSGYPHIFVSDNDALGDETYQLKHFYYDGAAFQSESVGTTTEAIMDGRIILIDGSTKPYGIGKSFYKGIYEIDKSSGSWVFSKILPFYSDTFGAMSYTSPASAMVAGLIGLMVSAHPTWTIDQIYWAITTSAKDLGTAGHDRYFGWGRIDADAALKKTEPLVDTTVPTASISYPVSNGEVENGSISVTGTATDANFTRYSLFYKAHSASTYTSISFYTHTSKNGEIIGTWDTSTLSYGQYDLKLEVSDWYTTTTYTETVNVGIDTNPPSISLTTLATTTDPTPTITGTAIDEMRTITSVEYQMNGTSGSWSSCTANDGTFDESNESFSCTISPALTNGVHVIYVRATDAKGNISTGSSIASMNVFIGLETDFTHVIQTTSNISTSIDSTMKQPNGAVYATASDDTYLYIGGAFNAVGDVKGKIALLDTTSGTAHASFPSVFGGTVYTIAADGSGGWYIGGSFLKVGSESLPYLAHIKPDYSVDTTWVPNPDSYVYSITVSGSDVYVGGEFSTIGGATRNKIAKLNTTNGNADGTWNPDANGSVWTITITSSDIYVGGEFTTIGGSSRNYIAKLNNSTGVADSSWDANAGNTVYTIAITGSDIYAGGKFTTIGGQTRNRIAKLNNSTGTADGTWNASANNEIYVITIVDTSIYVGGNFTSIGGSTRYKIARLNNSTGTADSWNPSASISYKVYSILYHNSAIYAGGTYTRIGGATRYRIAKLSTSSNVADATWDVGLPPESGTYGVRALAGYGSYVCAGGDVTFTADKTAATKLARYRLSDRTLDATWLPYVDSTVNAIAIDGIHVYVGGLFTNVSTDLTGQHAYIAKLNSLDTSLDVSWKPSLTGSVSHIDLVDSNIYFSGNFTGVGMEEIMFLAKVDNITGDPDTGWTPNPDASVEGISASGTSLYASGMFSSIGGLARAGLAKVNTTNGSADASWNPLPAGSNTTGNHLFNSDELGVIGAFSINSRSRSIARFDTATGSADTVWAFTPGGSIYDFMKLGSDLYFGGSFSVMGSSLARVDYTTGVQDTSWKPAIGNVSPLTSASVQTMLSDSSGLAVGGNFESVNSAIHPNFAFFPNYNAVITETNYDTTVSEAGTTDTFTVSLTNAPTSNVTLTLGATQGVSLSPSTLTFTSANWNTPQTVTMTVSNNILDGTRTSIVTLTPTSSDTNYNGITMDSLSVAVNDTSPVLTPTPVSSSSSGGGSSPDPSANIPPGAKAPNLYSVVPVDGSHILLYFAEGDDPIDRYILEYGTKEGEYPYSVANIGGKGTRTYTVGSLSPNTTYYFRIRGAHGTGVGPWGNVLSGKTKGLISFNQLVFTDSTLTPAVEEEPHASDTCLPYTVKSGDTLWKIAQTVLGDSRTYKEIIEKNKGTYPSLETSTSLKTGWILEIPCSSETPAPDASEGYDLNVKVVDTKNNPVKGAKVTLHSTVQEQTTDNDGIAHFTNVEKGDHRVLISYQNSQGEQSISLTGENKEYTLNITISLHPLTVPLWMKALFAGMAVVIAVLGRLLWKKKIKEK